MRARMHAYVHTVYHMAMLPHAQDFDQWGADGSAAVTRERITVKPINGLFLSTWYKVKFEKLLQYRETAGASGLGIDDSIMEYELFYDKDNNIITANSMRIGYGMYQNMEGFCCQATPGYINAGLMNTPAFGMCGNVSMADGSLSTPENRWKTTLDFGWEAGSADRCG